MSTVKRPRGRPPKNKNANGPNSHTAARVLSPPMKSSSSSSSSSSYSSSLEKRAQRRLVKEQREQQQQQLMEEAGEDKQQKANRIIHEAIAKARERGEKNIPRVMSPESFPSGSSSAHRRERERDRDRDRERDRGNKTRSKASKKACIVPSSKPKQKAKIGKIVIKFGGMKKKRETESSEEGSDEERPPRRSFKDDDSTRRSNRQVKRKKYAEEGEARGSDEEVKVTVKTKKTSTAAARKEPAQQLFVENPSEEDAAVVDKIMSSRIVKNEVAPGVIVEVEEFFVKYKNYSYLHCEWAVEQQLEKDKRIQQKIKRFKIKQAQRAHFFADMEEDPFNPDYVEVDRVLEVSYCEDKDTGEVVYYLVKWCSLPYEDSTWELKGDVDQSKIEEFELLQAARPDSRRMERPPASLWKKRDQSREYRNSNVLRDYQLEGVNWLLFNWYNRRNCILADEMGLGKTIQCIAHVAMMLERKVLGPFLVVAPLSTLPNWINEFKRFTPEVSVQLYHGPAKERMSLLKQIRKPQGPHNMCPVVVTSFEIAMIDRKFLQRFQWKYLIVDEGHRIKNLNCRLVRELKMLPTDNKLLLTGTPLQNNLAELWSLLNFLLPEVFDDLKSFESWFDIDTIGSNAKQVVANEREQNILHMLHQILTPFLLRRLKSDVTLEVPPKKEIVVYAPLTAKQESFYTAVVNKTIAKMLGQEKGEAPVVLTTDGRPKRRTRKPVDYKETDGDTPYDLEKYLERVQKEAELSPAPVVDVQMPLDSQINLKLQNILMLLKRCCNHPYLIEYPLDPATQEFKIDEQLVQTSGKFLILDRMLPELKKRGHKVLIFSQMTSILDILMDYCYLRGYQYSRLDGTMAYADREENMTKFSSDPEVFLFLLSTRAGGLGINLTAADTVIIFDSDWNPQADLQAQDRCHRIGQTKPVVVYRLVTANTIDQKILERASAKRKLEKMVIHKNKFKGGKAELKQTKSCVDVSELMDLLSARDYEKEVKSTTGKVISDEDLEFLLDRSDLLDKAKRSSKQKVGVFKVIEAKESSEINLTRV